MNVTKPQENADLVTFTEKIFNEKLHFCAVFMVAGLGITRQLTR